MAQEKINTNWKKDQLKKAFKIILILTLAFYSLRGIWFLIYMYYIYEGIIKG